MKATLSSLFAAACIIAGCSTHNDTTMTIKKFNLSPADTAAVEAAFEQVEPQKIACCDWPETAPYCPEASFRMFHNGDLLFIRYNVTEESTMAEASEDGGRVWEDSCVETFISPDSDLHYYNFEANCIGIMHIGYRLKGENGELATPEVYGAIKRTPTLEAKPFSLREGECSWQLTIAIPASALYKHNLRTWDGLNCTMNVYKCGDRLKNAHFLSWAPIDNPKPNFHMPDFFAKVAFEK